MFNSRLHHLLPVIVLALAPIATIGAQPASFVDFGPGGAPVAPEVRFHRIALRTGVTLRVAEAGDPNGEPILFLHGFTDSWMSWSPLVDRLPPGYRAIMPDHRGHGDSDRPACCYAIGDLAADVIALLDVLGIERATIVGHSLSSFVAQRIGGRYPQRVSRLVLVGSAETTRTPAMMQLDTVVQLLPDTLPISFVREFQQSTIHQPISPEYFAQVVGESMRVPVRIWKTAMSSLVSDDAKIDARSIDVPTLIVAGDRDAVFSLENARALQSKIRGSKLRIYEQTGHAIHWERPGQFLFDLVSFIGDSRHRVAESGPVRRSDLLRARD